VRRLTTPRFALLRDANRDNGTIRLTGARRRTARALARLGFLRIEDDGRRAAITAEGCEALLVELRAINRELAACP